MPSRDLADLEPKFRGKVTEYLLFLADVGISVIVTCTYRSSEEQDKLYAQGRTDPGKIVTYACGGQSLHNCTLEGKPASKAVDLVFGTRKKVYWSGPWWLLGMISKYFGLAWGGDWKHKDNPHFESKV